MITVDTPITFQNARITGEKVDPEVHHHQEFKRGEPGFIMSRGELMTFNECPAKWIAGVQGDESSLMVWGSLIDCLLIVPDQFQNRFAVCPECYPDKKTGDPKPWNFNADFCKQWREDQEGKTVLKSEVYRQAKIAVAKLQADDEIQSVLAGAAVQVAIQAEYVDPGTELIITLRCLPDVVPVGEFFNSLVDLKTTNSAEPRAWGRRVDSDNLDAQAALYLDLWKAATGEGRTDFRHIIQESDPPYHVELRLLSEEFIELGRLKYQSALKKYCSCLKSIEWPGYESRQRFGKWALTEPEAWQLSRL